MSRRPTLIFDLDGTLIDATRAIVTGFNHVLTRRGVPEWSRGRVLAMMGRPLADMFAPLAGDDPGEVQVWVKEYVEFSRTQAGSGIELLPGARSLLEISSRHYRMGVNTSRSTGSAVRILTLLGVHHLLSEIVGVDQVKNPKPHPEGNELLLRRLGAAPDQSLMLGDTPDDVQAARSAGVRAFAVATGYFSSLELRAAGAQKVFDDLHAFQDYLEAAGF